MKQAPRSPVGRPPLGSGEVPSPEQMHGKPWLRGDPHSKYRFMRCGTTGGRAAMVAVGGRGGLRVAPPLPPLTVPTLHAFVDVPDNLLQCNLRAGC